MRATDPDRNEWYFEECPLSEAYECCAYEYARESNSKKEIVAQWRRHAKGNKIEDYLERSGGFFDPPSNTGTYAYFPSWPDKPFLSVPPNTRKLWRQVLGIPENLDALLFERPIEVNSWDERRNGKLLEGFNKDGQPSCLDGHSQYVVFEIDWTQHDQALIEKFQAWLKRNRPQDKRPTEMRGRGNPGRGWRQKLTYLGLYRLLKGRSIYDAIAFLKDQVLEDENLKLRPSEHPQDWKRAAMKAEEIIQWFEQPSPEGVSTKRLFEAYLESGYFEDSYPEE